MHYFGKVVLLRIEWNPSLEVQAYHADMVVEPIASLKNYGFGSLSTAKEYGLSEPNPSRAESSRMKSGSGHNLDSQRILGKFLAAVP